MSADNPFPVLVQDWLAAYDDFFAILHLLSPQQYATPGVCGQWTIKQIVAHLSGWHYEAFRRYIQIAAGDPLDKTYDTDAFNAFQVEGRQHLTWEQTLADLREAITILHHQTQEIPAHLAAAEPRYGAWLRGLTRDVNKHQNQIIAWLNQESL